MKQPTERPAGARRRLLALYYLPIRYLFYSCGHVAYENVRRTHQNASFHVKKKSNQNFWGGAVPPQWLNGASQETRLLSWTTLSTAYAWYTFDGNQADGLWTLVWKVETGCRSNDVRRVSNHESDFVIVLGDICLKNSGAQAWMCAAQTLYFSAHTKK